MASNIAPQSALEAQVTTFVERAKNNQLSSNEVAMIQKFIYAKATKKLIELKNANTLRLYHAVQNGKGEELKEAIFQENNEKIIQILEITPEEAMAESRAIFDAQNELFRELGNDKETFLQFGKIQASALFV